LGEKKRDMGNRVKLRGEKLPPRDESSTKETAQKGGAGGRCLEQEGKRVRENTEADFSTGTPKREVAMWEGRQSSQFERQQGDQGQ